MKINILTLCDFAADYNGRLTIAGTMDRLPSSQFPSLPYSFYLACQFDLKPDSKIGDHIVVITFFDKESGDAVMQEQQLRLSVSGVDPQSDRRLLASLVVKIDGFSFNHPGTYVVKVKTDDEEKDIELYVDKVE